MRQLTQQRYKVLLLVATLTLISFIDAIAFNNKHSVLANPVTDPPVCYLQTEDGSIFDLSRVCGSSLKGTTANPTQVRRLLQTYECPGCQLSGINLVNANLSSSFLSGANLSGANLSGAKLSESELSGANLNGANLRGADLSGADLSGVSLNQADLTGAILTEAIMPNGTLHN